MLVCVRFVINVVSCLCWENHTSVSGGGLQAELLHQGPQVGSKFSGVSHFRSGMCG